jgi:hypothetical protein
MTVHRVVDKVPIFTDKALWSDSEYPQPGTIRCEVLESLPEAARITIARPDGLESAQGQAEFVIHKSELI